MLNFENDRHTINSLNQLTSKGPCYINMEHGRAWIRVLFPVEHPMSHRGYALVCGETISFSRDERGEELPWARILRKAGPQPSSKPCHNHGKPGCTADTCF